MPTVADHLMELLAERGVTHLFGMPGSHSTHLYDALHRQGAIRTVLIRNEQAGAYAADGFARVTGRPGVVCTTAGPGATNALSGIAEAFADSIPVLLLTGQVNASRLHQECGAYHELDLEAVFRPAARYVATVRNVHDLPGMVRSAFAAMTDARPGPAVLILPQDLMAAALPHPLSRFPAAHPPRSAPEVPESVILEAVEILREADRPLILAGGGATHASIRDALRQLAIGVNGPVVTTLNGKGILDERDPYALGHARGLHAMNALPHADAMLAIGCRFTEVLTRFGTMPVPAGLIQVDLDPRQIGMNHPVRLGIHGDARDVIPRMAAHTALDHDNQWSSLWEHSRNLPDPNPEWLIQTLRQELPEDAVVFTDACEMGLRMQADFPAYSPRSFFYPSNYIALGWGFPAAVGAAVALNPTPDAPARWVCCVCGDGGFTMGPQELLTAVKYRLPLVVVVHNDGAYGAIKNLQRLKHDARYHDTELNNPDFQLLGRAFGVPTLQARDASGFADALRRAMQNRFGPTLIEVPDSWRYLRR